MVDLFFFLLRLAVVCILVAMALDYVKKTRKKKPDNIGEKGLDFWLFKTQDSAAAARHRRDTKKKRIHFRSK